MGFQVKAYVNGYTDGETIETEDGWVFHALDTVDNGASLAQVISDAYDAYGKNAYDEAQYAEDIEVHFWVDVEGEYLIALMPTETGALKRVNVDLLQDDYMYEQISDAYANYQGAY